jgi:hypothetical protein
MAGGWSRPGTPHRLASADSPRGIDHRPDYTSTIFFNGLGCLNTCKSAYEGLFLARIKDSCFLLIIAEAALLEHVAFPICRDLFANCDLFGKNMLIALPNID